MHIHHENLEVMVEIKKHTKQTSPQQPPPKKKKNKERKLKVQGDIETDLLDGIWADQKPRGFFKEP